MPLPPCWRLLPDPFDAREFAWFSLINKKWHTKTCTFPPFSLLDGISNTPERRSSREVNQRLQTQTRQVSFLTRAPQGYENRPKSPPEQKPNRQDPSSPNPPLCAIPPEPPLGARGQALPPNPAAPCRASIAPSPPTPQGEEEDTVTVPSWPREQGKPAEQQWPMATGAVPRLGGDAPALGAPRERCGARGQGRGRRFGEDRASWQRCGPTGSPGSRRKAGLPHADLPPAPHPSQTPPGLGASRPALPPPPAARLAPRPSPATPYPHPTPAPEARTRPSGADLNPEDGRCPPELCGAAGDCKSTAQPSAMSAGSFVTLRGLSIYLSIYLLISSPKGKGGYSRSVA